MGESKRASALLAYLHLPNLTYRSGRRHRLPSPRRGRGSVLGLSLTPRHVGKLLCNSKMRQTMDGQTRTPRTGPSVAAAAGVMGGKKDERGRGKAEALMRAQYFVIDTIDTKGAVLT